LIKKNKTSGLFGLYRYGLKYYRQLNFIGGNILRKRIKVSLPKLIKDLLNEDLIYFELKMERLCNLIVQEMGYDQTLRLHEKIVNDKKANVYFNLNSRNTSFFKDMLEESEENLETEYFRRLLSTYVNLHPSIRERVIKKRLFLEIETAIKNSIEIKIAVNKEIYNVIPLEILRDSKTNYNLLKVKNNEEVFLYKIKNIEILKI